MRRGFGFQGLFPGCLTGSTGHPTRVWGRLEGVELRARQAALPSILIRGAQGQIVCATRLYGAP
jgi:hypothetical protein